MPQANKNKKEIEKIPGAKAPAGWQQGRRILFITIGAVFIIVILVMIGAFYYFSEDQKNLRLNVVTVDGIPIRMDYFIKRVKFTGADPISALKTVSDERLIKLGAARYGIVVSSENITQELIRQARGSSDTIAESEFQAWYRQMLNDTGLSDAEFKDITATNLLAAGLQDYLAEKMPTVAEQVHMYAILLGTSAEAEAVKARIDKGEAFADLAREVSLDEGSKAGGGDMGWLPRGVLDPRFEGIAFNIEPGEVSIPVPQEAPSPTDQGAATGAYLLIMVSEKANAREVDAEFLPIVKSHALDNWLLAESQQHTIKYNFNSEINAWIQFQIAKGQPSTTGTGQ